METMPDVITNKNDQRIILSEEEPGTDNNPATRERKLQRLITKILKDNGGTLAAKSLLNHPKIIEEGFNPGEAGDELLDPASPVLVMNYTTGFVTLRQENNRTPRSTHEPSLDVIS